MPWANREISLSDMLLTVQAVISDIVLLCSKKNIKESEEYAFFAIDVWKVMCG